MSTEVSRAFACLMFLGTSFVVVSCSHRDVLIGKWQAKNRQATLEFSTNGTASFHEAQVSFGGKVRFVGKGQLMIGDLSFVRFKILSKDELSWTPPNSQPDIYERVKE